MSAAHRETHADSDTSSESDADQGRLNTHRAWHRDQEREQGRDQGQEQGHHHRHEHRQELSPPFRHHTLFAPRYRPRRPSSGVNVPVPMSTSRDGRANPTEPPHHDPSLSPSYGPMSESRRQNLMAMDRKRRLTGSTQESGRSRHGPNTFHERDDAVERLLDNRPSNARLPLHPQRRSSSQVISAPDVVDLTRSPPTPNRIHTSLPLPPTPPPPPPPPLRSPRSSRTYVVPRWQPDAEAAQCPICTRPFSFLFRRHHCRKCGRVVCNDCSPHRITIPRQYIVSPPGLDGTLSGSDEVIDLTGNDDDDNDDNDDSEDDGGELFTSHPPTVRWQSARQHRRRPMLDGGEKVRLCNPCVPDPQPEHQPSYSSRTLPLPPLPVTRPGPPFTNEPRPGPTPHSRSLNTIEPFPGMSVPNYMPPMHHHSRSRPARSHASTYDSLGLPPPPFMSASGAAFGVQRQHDRARFPSESSISGHSRYHSVDQGSASSSSTTTASRARIRSIMDHPASLPQLLSGHVPPPRRIVNEDDVCPICRRLLPARGPDGDETAREAHIVDCINARDPAAHASPPRSQTHMLTFVATEKDCVGEDGGPLECSICMVEYDVGEALARLECLCKFHRDCIVSWFDRKQECPVHKIT